MNSRRSASLCSSATCACRLCSRPAGASAASAACRPLCCSVPATQGGHACLRAFGLGRRAEGMLEPRHLSSGTMQVTARPSMAIVCRFRKAPSQQGNETRLCMTLQRVICQMSRKLPMSQGGCPYAQPTHTAARHRVAAPSVHLLRARHPRSGRICSGQRTPSRSLPCRPLGRSGRGCRWRSAWRAGGGGALAAARAAPTSAAWSTSRTALRARSAREPEGCAASLPAPGSRASLPATTPQPCRVVLYVRHLAASQWLALEA
jgi:hypothetical protein